MNFEQLIDFIENKMSMSHIYQPLLIRSLVETGGMATLRQLAHAFLSQDESQIIYYEKRIKEMPLKVLSKHKVVSYEGGLVSLATKKLTFEQKAKIKMLCEQKIQEFVEKRGLSIWDYRLLDSDPIPDSIRYQVLKESRGRCELCGATKKERPLDIDHIIPRSRGGKNEKANLQVLCSKCNRSKGNKDNTDFHNQIAEDYDPSCPFCNPVTNIIAENESVFAIYDKYLVTPLHTLVIPKRHTSDYFTMVKCI